MRVRMSCKDMLAGVGASMRAIRSWSFRDVLKFVRFTTDHGGSFAGVGHDLTLQWWLEDAMDVEQPGAVLLPPKEVQAFLDPFGRDDPVTIESESDTVRLTCGSAHIAFQVPDADSFPVTPSLPDVMTLVRRDAFLDAYACASRVAGDPGRHALDAVLIEPAGAQRLAIVGTDGRLLICTEIEDGPHDCPTALVPTAAFSRPRWERKRDDVLGYGVTDAYAILRGTRTTAWVPLSHGRFPFWRVIIPNTYQPGFRVDAKPFLNAIKSAAVVCLDDPRWVDVAVGPHELNVSATDPKKNTTSVTIPVAGDANPFRCLLDPDRLSRLIQCFSDDTITLHYVDDCLHVRNRTNRIGVLKAMAE